MQEPINIFHVTCCKRALSVNELKKIHYTFIEGCICLPSPSAKHECTSLCMFLAVTCRNRHNRSNPKTDTILKTIQVAELKLVLFPSVLFSIIAVSYAEEGCYQYRRKGNVTIDTEQCLWKNSTEPKPKRLCLESCFKNDTVRNVALN